MDERVEEIRPISRVRLVRKLALARPRRGRRELMYQLKRYHKAQKPQRTNLVTKMMPDVPKSTETSSGFNSNGVTDVKKRIAFDRAIILGERSLNLTSTSDSSM